ncbi:MAG: radical SAM family heme chaperone HemW [Synergistaceae bacterium]|jgi:oxygen-independent coproporphyrinogen-3 oxidase|nr:radical SAM family heme chaperone HemW [Synergistaceae bacterium]
MSLFSLYLHVPFCLSKCGYCSFHSQALGGNPDSSIEAWLTGVSREAGYIGRIWGGRPPLRTVFVGGGTPTVLPPSAWRRLLRLLENAFDLSEIQEATVEANPCSLTEEHLTLWRDSFVTRVSLGVQSLQDDELLWMGRRHDARTALRAIERTLACGFDTSADLIFGVASQTLRGWHDTLRRVVASGVGHISTYQLTLEAHTPLAEKLDREKSELPEGYSFYRFAQWYLPRRGLAQYEIASFARPGGECRHNLAYWRRENVLALGPAAWGYLRDDGFRYHNVFTPEEYASLTETGLPIAGAERFEGRAAGAEAAILALRTKWGIDAAEFTNRFGRGLWEEIRAILEGIPRRLVRIDDDGARLTPGGMRVGNAIWVELLSLDD